MSDYTEDDFKRFRKLEHEKLEPGNQVEWVFPSLGEPVLTFDRVTYYNGYSDRDKLTAEQIAILRKEGAMGCLPFRPSGPSFFRYNMPVGVL